MRPAPKEIVPAADLGTFDEPWAMAFLSPGELLVTQKRGTLVRLTLEDGMHHEVSGVPEVAYGGQGGLGDVIVHDGKVYLSWAEPGPNNTRGAAVGRATLQGDMLIGLEVIWRQNPKVTGEGHYGHRLVFDKDGFLFISSGDRQKLTPAQDLTQNLGKIARVHADGSIPEDNPFYAHGGVAREVWSLGHRNPLGLAFDSDGQLWEHEMGPRGGDEVNRVERGGNYGWPVVSNGDHYDGAAIPDHHTRPDFIAPTLSWTPVIAPAGLIIRGRDAFLGGLVSEGVVRVQLPGTEVQRYPLSSRIREIEQGADGTIWVMEDGARAHLRKLMP